MGARRQEQSTQARDATAAALNDGKENGFQQAAREEQERRDAQRKASDDARAERDRLEQVRLAEKAARAAELKRLATDPAVAAPAVSAIMCTIETEVGRLRQELAQQKRATALSGVVNLTDRHDIATELVQASDELAQWGAALRRLGAKRLPCKDVAGVVACRNSIETCAAADRDPAEVWAAEQATLWASDKPRPMR